MKKQQMSFVQMAQRIPARYGDGLLYHDPEKPRQPTLQVGLPDNKAKWIQRDEIGGLLSNAITTTPRK